MNLAWANRIKQVDKEHQKSWVELNDAEAQARRPGARWGGGGGGGGGAQMHPAWATRIKHGDKEHQKSWVELDDQQGQAGGSKHEQAGVPGRRGFPGTWGWGYTCASKA